MVNLIEHKNTDHPPDSPVESASNNSNGNSNSDDSSSESVVADTVVGSTKLAVSSMDIADIHDSNSGKHVSLIELMGTCNGHEMSMLVDSASTGNFISHAVVEQCNIPTLSSNIEHNVSVADGRLMTCSKYVLARVCIGKLVDLLKLIVAPIDHDIVLGLPWLVKHNQQLHIEFNIPSRIQYKYEDDEWCELPQKSNSTSKQSSNVQLCNMKVMRKCIRRKHELYIVNVQQVDQVNADIIDSRSSGESTELTQLLSEYSDVFPDTLPDGLPPDRGISHTIELEDNYKMPMIRPEYRKSSAELDWLHKEIQNGLAAGWIRPSKSPYAARVLLVKKPNSNEYRVCVDYRDLNRITRKNNYGLPRQDELFDRLNSAKWFSKIDLRTGYYQIQVAEQDRYKTAFKTRYGHYEYNVMPMGLCNAPATFMRQMNEVFDDMLDQYVVVYLDDILIYSKTKEEHIVHIRNVLDRLKQQKLYAKKSKCQFLQQQVSFLGHIVGVNGIQMDPSKVEAIVSWPIPNNIHEMRSFLGLAGYYRKFIDNYSKIATPLNELTKKDVTYKWTTIEQDAFDQLKHAITHAPVLVAPDMSKPFVVYTDASGYGVGAALMQDHGQGEQPVAYHSHKLNEHERNYPVYEQELLAVKLALVEWRHYLLGNHFTVYTDHQSLTWLKTQPNLSSRQCRWLDLFTEYNYSVEYIKGQTNQVADALSRRIDLKSLSAASISINNNVLQQVKQAYDNDVLAQAIITGADKALHSYKYDQIDGYIYYEDRLYIPTHCKQLITSILHEIHDSTTAGHGGIHKTLFKLQQQYYWPKMKQTVESYVKSCQVCQQDKHRTTLSNGLLQPHTVPDTRWHTISLDFVTALPMTSTGHDAILVITDKLSKMAHFIPTSTTVTAAQTVQLFIDNIFRIHGLPRKIISDRGTQFTSQLWSQLWKALGTKLNISTAYHPQTDGQTERTNQTMESMLRHYINWNETEWHKQLSLVEFAYNNSVQASTGYTPFYLMYGDNPVSPIDLIIPNSTYTPVNKIITNLQSELQQAKDNIRIATDKYTQHANQSRLDVTFKEGEMVLLKTTNLRVQAPDVANKLLPRYIGPLKISKVISPVAYQLDLPESMKCHPVFHVSRLQRYHESNNEQFPDRILVNRPVPPFEVNEPEWIVEKILDRCWRETGTVGTKGYKCWREWLVKWCGYDEEDSNTWETQSAFVVGTTVNEAFTTYEMNHPYSEEEMKWIKKYDKNKF